MNNKVECIFKELFERYPSLQTVKDEVLSAYSIIVNVYENGGKVLICGNGGSSADSAHIVGELMKGFVSQRPLSDEEKALFSENSDIAENLQGSLPAIDLTAQSALMTAFVNDVEPDMVFAQQIWGYCKDGKDVLVALSTSGNSKNVVNAVITAKALKNRSISLTGEKGGVLSNISDVCIKLPETETFKVQELTLPVYHALCAATEAHFFG